MIHTLQQCPVSSRRLAGVWWLLGLLALTFSTLCAFVLVAARSSLLGADVTMDMLFREALVLHVNLAVVVWFLACAGGVWVLSSGFAGKRIQWLAWGLSCLGLLGMVASPLAGSGLPILANYVPVLEHPLFLAGLICFIAGIVLCAMVSMPGVLRKLKADAFEPWQFGALVSMVAAMLALAAFFVALHGALPDGPERFEALAWGPGHLLQFVHMLLMMTVWLVLGARALGQEVASRHWLFAILGVAAIPLLAVPVILELQPGSSGYRHAFTLLMAWGVWPAALLLGSYILGRLVMARREVSMADALPLVFSILLFMVGCVLGTAIRGDSTMVPAHYHGTVGAVTLAYMALGYRLLPIFGLEEISARWVCRQVSVYGGGLLLLATALAWAGWLGAPRKTMPLEIVVQPFAHQLATGLAGLGGALAIAGAVLYVFNVLYCFAARR